MLGNLACFFAVCCVLFKIKFSKNSFRNTIRVPNNLDPDQDRHSVGPDLGPNCLQRLSTDDTGRQRGKAIVVKMLTFPGFVVSLRVEL